MLTAQEWARLFEFFTIRKFISLSVCSCPVKFEKLYGGGFRAALSFLKNYKSRLQALFGYVPITWNYRTLVAIKINFFFSRYSGTSIQGPSSRPKEVPLNRRHTEIKGTFFSVYGPSLSPLDRGVTKERFQLTCDHSGLRVVGKQLVTAAYFRAKKYRNAGSKVGFHSNLFCDVLKLIN